MILVIYYQHMYTIVLCHHIIDDCKQSYVTGYYQIRMLLVLKTWTADKIAISKVNSRLKSYRCDLECYSDRYTKRYWSKKQFLLYYYFIQNIKFVRVNVSMRHLSRSTCCIDIHWLTICGNVHVYLNIRSFIFIFLYLFLNRIIQSIFIAIYSYDCNINFLES